MKSKWIILMISVMLICVSCLNDKNSDNESEEGTIVFTQKTHNDSVGPTEEYTCTVLDEGILELVDYSDEMAYLSGHVQEWKYRIVGEGQVRILWEHDDGWGHISEYMEIYTFDQNGKYTVEEDRLWDGVEYLLINSSSVSRLIQGYFINPNGQKFLYSLEKSELSEISIEKICEYIMKNIDDAVFVKKDWIPQKDFFESRRYAMKYADEKSNPALCLDGKSYLYFITYSEGSDSEISIHHYDLIAMKEGDEIIFADDRAEKVIEIFGEDWSDFE